MPLTQEQKDAFDMGAYGMLRAEVEDNLKPQAETMGRDMLIMSMLSDAQHLVEHNQKEQARQLINQAKYVLRDFPLNKMDEFLTQRRKG